MLENVKTLGMNVFHVWEGPDLWTGKGWNVDEVVCCTTLKGMYSGARPLRVTRTEGHQILWTETPQRKEHQRTALSTEWGSALFLILAVIGLPTSSTFSPLRIEVSIILSHPVYCVLWCRTKLRWHSKIQGEFVCWSWPQMSLTHNHFLRCYICKSEDNVELMQLCMSWDV